jgi:hypothetical protein
LKDTISLLVALQTLDSEAVQVAARKQSLPEKIRLLEETRQKQQGALDEAEEKLRGLTQRHRDQEEQLKRGVEGLKKAKQRLLDVKTNKEYQAILKEMEVIETLQGKVEDEIIALLEQVDHMKAAVKQHEIDLSAFLAVFAQEKQELEGQVQALDDNLARLKKKRQTLLEALPGDLVRRYETIREKRNGIAVISVWKEVCNGCHMNIPPQMYIELQRSQELRTCPNCHRIIYWRNEASVGES